MPELRLPTRVRTPEDIVRFFMYLDRVDQAVFHPDERFYNEEFHDDYGAPGGYTVEEAKLRDRLMNQVWEVASRHGLDPSEIALWVVDTVGNPPPPWAKGILERGGRKHWDPTEERPELGLPPARGMYRVGDLTFEVFRPKGLVTEVRVTAQGSPKPLIVKPEPRLQPVGLTLQRITEDLYAMAQEPAKIRELIIKSGLEPEIATRTELMVRWAEEHRPQIVGAMALAIPAIVPFKRV